MRWYEHLTFTLAILFPMLKSPEALTIALISSLLPDIDSENSYITKKLKVLGYVLHTIAKIILFPFSVILRKNLYSHRGFLHTIWACGILALIIFLITQNYDLSLLFIAGFLLHLLEDATTVMGVKPFMPFSDIKIKGIYNLADNIHKNIMLLISGSIIVLLTYDFQYAQLFSITVIIALIALKLLKI